MKAFDDFIKDANSILNTLDKDYEAMQSQKSGVRQDQVDKFDDLCESMGEIIGQYSKTIWDFRNKVDRAFEPDGTAVTIYEYPNDTDKILVMVPQLYWTSGGPSGKPTYRIDLYVKPKSSGAGGYYDSDSLAVSETGIELMSGGFDGDKGYSDLVSIFLNHCPTYEQLDIAFQTVATEFIKRCVTCIQTRNENLADKIKSITR